MSTRLNLYLATLALVLGTGAVRAQTVTWGGGFPNDQFSVATNWVGGATPPITGSATVNFTGNSDSSLNLDESVILAGITVQDNLENGSSPNIYSGNGSALTLGSGGISVVSDGTASGNVTINVPLTLLASQVWSQVQNAGSSVTVNGAISGPFGLTLAGDGNVETWTLNSGASAFSGGVTVAGVGATLAVGTGTMGPAGAPTSGPVGTGTLSLGDGTTLTTTTSSPISIANALVIGGQNTGQGIVFGGPTSQSNPGLSILALSGPVTLDDNESDLVVGANSTVTFSGNLIGNTGWTCVEFGSTGGANSLAIVQGDITNVWRIDLVNNVSVILDGTGPSQFTGVSDVGTTSSNYLGFGAAYASPGSVTAALSFLSSTSAGNINGTLGFDTTSGPAATFSDPVDLTSFTAGDFVGLGSATSAILSPAAVITPPGGASGTVYPFGGGGGTLTVQSTLSDGSSSRSLVLSPGNAPLTLVLSGALNYSGSTSVTGGVLIFDTPLPLGGLNLTAGYIGGTPNSGYTDGSSNIQNFVNLFNDSDATGVIGFDSLAGQRTVTSDISMAGLPSNLYLGTATSVLYSGTIAPNAGGQYEFAGVKGGQVTVSSVLSGSNTVDVGLPNPIESFSQSLGYVTDSSVTLSGVNTYSGTTTLNSGYLYVTNNSSLGSGASPLEVPGNSGANGWAATLATSGAIVTVSNPIVVGNGGLALNTGSPYALTLTGNISEMEDDPGSLGIFGPVVLTGNNSYTGGTFIQGATVTVASDNGLGTGSVNASNSTLSFPSASPVLAPLTNSQVYLQGTTATFAGIPLINNLYMAQSTLNLDGPSAVINGIGDEAGSGNIINLGGSGTELTIDTDGNGYNFGGTFHGIIEGAGSLAVTGTGGNSLDLRGANNYSGGTTITGNIAVIASNNSALGTGPVTVEGGGVVTNTGVTLTNPLVLTGSMGAISGVAGFGTFSPGGTLAFQNYSVVDPGRTNIGTGGGGTGLNVPIAGALSFGGSTTIQFGPMGGYVFALTDASLGAGTGYSTVNMPGETLDITATAINPFQIRIFSYDPATNLAGNALNFSSSGSYSWTLVSAGSISGFSAADFVFNTANFTNGTGSGSFNVSQSGGDLMLNFTPVPEPSTWAMMAGGLFALAGAAVRRRRT
jgi:fibronectin-binding autotransporter adhesin